jgi:site-specific DNA-methyltransferase (adenine-specific)
LEQYVNKIIEGDALQVLKDMPSEFVDMVITSPPYWALRDYGIDGQVGLEENPQKFIYKLCAIFDEIHRVLKKGGTCWVNLGDTYGGQSWRDEKSFRRH